MRILLVTMAVMTLAAAPCAWDTDPREARAIVGQVAAPDEGRQRTPRSNTPAAQHGMLE